MEAGGADASSPLAPPAASPPLPLPGGCTPARPFTDFIDNGTLDDQCPPDHLTHPRQPITGAQMSVGGKRVGAATAPLGWLFMIGWRALVGRAVSHSRRLLGRLAQRQLCRRAANSCCRIGMTSAASCLRRHPPHADRRPPTTNAHQGQATSADAHPPTSAERDQGSSAGGSRRTGHAGRPRRAYRRAALTLRPAKLVPLDPEHEQQALAALTELLRALLTRGQASP